MLQDTRVAFESIQVKQRRTCCLHQALELILSFIRVALNNQLVNGHVPPVHSILYRSHHLFRFRHALHVEIGAVFTKQFQSTKIASSNCEKDCAYTIFFSLLIDLDFPLPDHSLVRLLYLVLDLFCLSLFVSVAFFCDFQLTRKLFDHRLERLAEQEFNDLKVTSHNRYMKACSSLLIFLILHTQLLKHLDDFEVAMVHSVVQAIETLRVSMIDRIS